MSVLSCPVSCPYFFIGIHTTLIICTLILSKATWSTSNRLLQLLLSQTFSQFRCFRALWWLNAVLDLYVLPQALQGRTTPSKWLASIWSLIVKPAPSFPHTLQILAFSFLLGTKFWLISIIDLTWMSSSYKSWQTKFLTDGVISWLNSELSFFKA